MKLHIGCGTIYLKGYINIDTEPHFLIDDVPLDILEINTTTVDKYYKNDFCKGSGKIIADKCAPATDLPFLDGSAEEIIMIHVLEHIPWYEVNKTLGEFFRVLKNNGVLRIGVPDVKETAKLLVQANTSEEEDWAIRLLHGTQRNKWSHHYCGYTERTLEKLLSDCGFSGFEKLPNINFYPAIYLKALKK